VPALSKITMGKAKNKSGQHVVSLAAHAASVQVEKASMTAAAYECEEHGCRSCQFGVAL
jgi:hypothetical protein